MPSNLDLLRDGQPIEFEPGLSGRLNREKKVLELSDGTIVDASRNRDLFPESEQELQLSREKESIRKGIKGPFDEFTYQFTSQGLPGGIKNFGLYAKYGKDYVLKESANKAVSQELSEESPITSSLATFANLWLDLATTRGMNASKAASFLTAGSAGPRLVTEPQEVGKDVALAALAGKGIDKAIGGLSKVADRRKAIQELPGKQQAVRDQNILGKQAVDAANREEMAAYNQSKQAVSDKNAQAMQEFKAAQEEAKLAKKQSDLQAKKYQEDLEKIPQLQKKAQAEYSETVIKNAEDVAKAFPKEAKLYPSQIGVDAYIEQNIVKGAATATREGEQAARIIRNLFGDAEGLSAKELASRYKSLEGAIQNASPEVRTLLADFKGALSQRLPQALADAMAFKRVMPKLQSQIAKDVQSTLDNLRLPISGSNSREALGKVAEAKVKQIFEELTPEQFLEKMQNGSLKQQFLEILSPEEFTGKSLQSLKKVANPQAPSVVDPLAQRDYNAFVDLFTKKLEKNLAAAEMKVLGVTVDAEKKLGGKLKNTLGVAEEIQLPPPPVSEPIQMPQKPTMLPNPTQPTPQVFTPQIEPNLAPAQGFADRAGDFLEKSLFGGSGLASSRLAKLAGLKYLMGKGAVPLEAGYIGAKALTSPGPIGEVSRMTFRQGGIEALISWMQQYPSYHDGILESPQDRRSFTKELEDAIDIPIEQKAVLQSKVNRGKPLDAKI